MRHAVAEPSHRTAIDGYFSITYSILALELLLLITKAATQYANSITKDDKQRAEKSSIQGQFNEFFNEQNGSTIS